MATSFEQGVELVAWLFVAGSAYVLLGLRWLNRRQQRTREPVSLDALSFMAVIGLWPAIAVHDWFDKVNSGEGD